MPTSSTTGSNDMVFRLQSQLMTCAELFALTHSGLAASIMPVQSHPWPCGILQNSISQEMNTYAGIQHIYVASV